MLDSRHPELDCRESHRQRRLLHWPPASPQRGSARPSGAPFGVQHTPSAWRRGSVSPLVSLSSS